jgi:hypothetical protein
LCLAIGRNPNATGIGNALFMPPSRAAAGFPAVAALRALSTHIAQRQPEGQMSGRWITVDGNDACAAIAYQLSDVIAIYPITPSSGMAESADAWSAAHRPNLWGAVPSVVEMQSEGGAAGAVHGRCRAAAGDDLHGQPGPAPDDPEHVSRSRAS